MKVTKDSHVDHALSEAQQTYLFERFADKAAFFIETVELPEALGTVPCGLHGPLMGDAPLGRDMEQGAGGFLTGTPVSARPAVWRAKRGTRAYDSRVTSRTPRPTRLVTVIAGPHEEEACILFTAFGGPLTPQEPADPTCKDVAASEKFWSEHALSAEVR